MKNVPLMHIVLKQQFAQHSRYLVLLITNKPFPQTYHSAFNKKSQYSIQLEVDFLTPRIIL